MTDEKTQQPLGVASDLNAELDALRKENETLHKMLAIAAKQREKYLSIEAENKALKNNWRMTFAGQAMQAFLSRLSVDDDIDYDFVAKESFKAAKAMAKQLNI